MSDFSQGPGWWQASDGKWYPPEQAPGAQVAPPAAPYMGDPFGQSAANPYAQGVPGAGMAPAYGGAPMGMATGAFAGRLAGKTRNPWGVWLLCLLPLYSLYWYYSVNEEMRRYSDQIKVNPVMSILALIPGSFVIIPPIVSWIKTGSRIKQAQQISGSTTSMSVGVGFLLGIIGFGVVYYQSHLNKVWDMHGNPEPGSPIY